MSAQPFVTYQRYKMGIDHGILRAFHEQERLGRMRKEILPAPVAVDVTVQACPGPAESVAPASEQPNAPTDGDEEGGETTKRTQ